jgi:Lon protease-like protein
MQTRPEEGSVGCLAEVKEIQSLPDGGSNIITIGVMRFRLIDYVETDRTYFVGDIEFFEDDEDDADQIESLADEVHELFERVAKAAFQLSGSRGQFPEIPKTNSEQLSFLISTAFNLDVDLKYRMLETTSTRVRLEKLREILLGTVTKMEDSAGIHKIAQTNGHSKKKLDL